MKDSKGNEALAQLEDLRRRVSRLEGNWILTTVLLGLWAVTVLFHG